MESVGIYHYYLSSLPCTKIKAVSYNQHSSNNKRKFNYLSKASSSKSSLFILALPYPSTMRSARFISPLLPPLIPILHTRPHVFKKSFDNNTSLVIDLMQQSPGLSFFPLTQSKSKITQAYLDYYLYKTMYKTSPVLV